MMKILTWMIRLLFLGLFAASIATGKMMLWLVLFGLSLVGAILFGRLYCGYACPMNTVMTPLDHLAKKFGIQKDREPSWLRKGFIPWLAVGISVAAVVLFRQAWQISLPIMLVWLAISVLAVPFYPARVFHNQICPFGALQKLFGRKALISRTVDPSDCVGCGKCLPVCPAEAISIDSDTSRAVIRTDYCHQCTNCSTVCPTSAISVSRRKA